MTSINEEQINELTRKAVQAALAVIDAAQLKNPTGHVGTRRSTGPCGDRLAAALHNVIEPAITEQVNGPRPPY